MGESFSEEAADITKQSELIKESQKDLETLDVLVCGQCHKVFNFLEDLSEHKESGDCSKKSEVSKACDKETQVQVWAFCLWKNKEPNSKNEDENKTSWKLYQQWVNLSKEEKEPWIRAGEFIQWTHKVACAEIDELRKSEGLKKDPLALDDINHVSGASNLKNGIGSASKSESRPSAPEQYVVEKILAKRFSPKRKTWEYKIKWENFPEDECTWEPLAHLDLCKDMVEEFENKLRKLREKNKSDTSTLSRPSSFTSSQSSALRPVRSSKQKAMNQVKEWCGSISDEENSLKRPYDGSSDDSFEKRIKLEAESEDFSDEEKRKKPISFLKKIPRGNIINNGMGISGKLPDNVLIPDAKGVVRINQKQLPSLSSGVYIMSKTAGIIKLDSAASKIATSGGQAIVKVAPKVGQTHIKIVKKDGTTTRITSTNKVPIPPLKSNSTTKPVRQYKAVPVNKTKKPTPIKPSQPVEKPVEADFESKDEESDSDYGLEALEFPTDIPLPEPESPPGDFVLDPSTGKLAGVEYPNPEPEPEPVAESESEHQSSQAEQSKSEPTDTKSEATDVANESVESLDTLVKLAAADITEADLQLTTDPDMVMETSTAETTSVSETPPTDVTSSIVKSNEEVKILNDSITIKPAQEKATLSVSQLKEEKPEVTIMQKVKVPGGGTNILKHSLQKTPIMSRSKMQQRVMSHSMAGRTPGHINQMVRTTTTQRRIVPSSKPKFQISPASRYGEPQRVISSNREHFARKIGQTTIYKSTIKKEQPKTPVKRVTVYQSSVVPKTTHVQQYTTYTPQKSKQQTPFKTTHYKTTTQSYKPAPKKEQPSPVVMNSNLTPAKPKRVISMPSLSGDEEVSQVEETKVDPVPSQTVLSVEEDETTPALTSALSADQSELFTLGEGEAPIFITSDDGTVYQVAGQNEQGQTILVTQGADGQQQCLLVTSEATADEGAQEQQQPVEPQVVPSTEDLQEPLSVKTDEVTQDQVVAQVIRAEPPSPGGTHKVVVMLPDGNLMVTQVSPEEYASLELDK